MRYLSLFSGIEAATVAWGPLGWEPVAFCEVDPFPAAVLAARWPRVPNLGDIREVDWEEFVEGYGAVDVIVGGSPCFPAGTLVLCESGFKPIERVETGDMVVTHKGRLRPVLNIGSKMADTVILKGQGSVGVECTPNHPFYSREKRRVWDNARREYLMTHDDSPEWRDAEDMEGKFWLNVCNVEETPIPRFPECGRGERGKGYIEGFDFTEDFFYFVGRWLGDGWANAHRRKGRKESLMKRTYVCCSHEESGELCAKLDLTGLHFGMSDNGSTVRFTCSSTQLHDWLVGNFGVHADGKNIPAWCYGMDRALRSAMLRGYLDADGTKVANGSKSTTINRKLSLGVKMLAGSLGMATSVTLNVNDRDAEIEGRKVRERPNYVSSHYASSRSAFFADSGFYGLVRSVSEGREGVRVYNLEVEGDNSYTADGIAVHNCQSFSIAGGRESLDGESRLMFEYIRAVRSVAPRWVVWENVPGVLCTKDDAFGQLLGGLADCGYHDLAYRVLDAQFFGVAQRRRRVFVVGHLGRGYRAAAVLQEPGCLRGDNPPSREKRQELARTAGYRAPRHLGGDAEARPPEHVGVAAFMGGQSRTCGSIGYQPEVSPTLRGAASGTNSVPSVIAFAQNARDEVGLQGDGDMCGAPSARPGMKQTTYVMAPAMAVRTANTNANGRGVAEEVAHTLDGANGQCVFTQYGEEVAGALTARHDSSPCSDRGQNVLAVIPENAIGRPNSGTNGPMAYGPDEPSPTLRASGDVPAVTCLADDAAGAACDADLAGSLKVGGKPPAVRSPAAVPRVCALRERAGRDGGGKGPLVQTEVSGTPTPPDDQRAFHAGAGGSGPIDPNDWIVRGLTPVECERLQGFPDGHTDLTGCDAGAVAETVCDSLGIEDEKGREAMSRKVGRWAGKCPDGPRYRACGNSMAVPVVEWLGRRMEMVDELVADLMLEGEAR